MVAEVIAIAKGESDFGAETSDDVGIVCWAAPYAVFFAEQMKEEGTRRIAAVEMMAQMWFQTAPTS